VLLGAGLTIAVFTRALGGRAGRTEGPPRPPAKESPAQGSPAAGRTSPAVQGSGAAGPAAGGAAAQAPRVLSPEEIRNLARVEWEKTSARAGELEGSCQLVRAMEVLANFPFEYRHTEYHGLAAKERERLSAECESRFEPLAKRMNALLDRPEAEADAAMLLDAGKALGRAQEEINAPQVEQRMEELRRRLSARLCRRLAPAFEQRALRAIPLTPLIWRPGGGASVRWAGESAEVTFSAAARGRELRAELPKEDAWNLSGYGTLSFTMPGCPERATFTVEIVSGGVRSAAVAAREGAVFAVQLDSLAIDLGKVERITLTLAEPAREEVRCTLSAVKLTPK